MTTSSIDAALDYLVTTFAATFGETTHVFDGPPVTGTELTLADRVWVGYSPINENLPAVTGDQDFAALGARSRNENYAVLCFVEHSAGSTAMQPIRAAAFAMLAQIETLLRGAGGNPGDCTLGGAVLFAQVAGGIEVHPMQNANGGTCGIQFHITCRARLT